MEIRIARPAWSSASRWTPDSAYADVAFHAVGLTSLQFRETPGGATHEIQSDISAPPRLRLEKRGDYISMSLAPAGGALEPASGSLRLPFKDNFYVGLGVCAHDDNALEQAVFSNVELTPVTTPTKRIPSPKACWRSSALFPPMVWPPATGG